MTAAVAHLHQDLPLPEDTGSAARRLRRASRRHLAVRPPTRRGSTFMPRHAGRGRRDDAGAARDLLREHLVEPRRAVDARRCCERAHRARRDPRRRRPRARRRPDRRPDDLPADHQRRRPRLRSRDRPSRCSTRCSRASGLADPTRPSSPTPSVRRPASSSSSSAPTSSRRQPAACARPAPRPAPRRDHHRREVGARGDQLVGEPGLLRARAHERLGERDHRPVDRLGRQPLALVEPDRLGRAAALDRGQDVRPAPAHHVRVDAADLRQLAAAARLALGQLDDRRVAQHRADRPVLALGRCARARPPARAPPRARAGRGPVTRGSRRHTSSGSRSSVASAIARHSSRAHRAARARRAARGSRRPAPAGARRRRARSGAARRSAAARPSA